jgi:obg-like ATPase 1
LSHIAAVDGIYHVTRAFEAKDIEHVEGDVDPVRDFEIIRGELLAKDSRRWRPK